MSAIYQTLLANAWATFVFIVVALGLSFIIWARFTQSLLGKDFWARLPFFGKMTGWKKRQDGTGDSLPESSRAAGATYVTRTLLTPMEQELYAYYADCLSHVGEREFTNAREFLKLSHQNGRKPMSPWLWVILTLLTLAEAIGTGLLIAPLLSNDITPTLAVVVGSVIALAIAAIALMITHGAGEDWFRNELLAKVRNSHARNSGFRKADGSKFADVVAPIGPEDDQRRDALLDTTARLAGRIGATTSGTSMSPKLWRLIAAAVFIVVFGAGTTAYRHYMFNKGQDAAHSGLGIASATPDYQSMFASGGGNGAQGSRALGGMPLPGAVASAAQQSQQQAHAAIRSDTKNANDAGIIILALIYVFTQLVGILTGYKYSFFDDDARKAYDNTHGELGYEGYLRHVVIPVANRAQMRLGELRSHLTRMNPGFRDNARPFDFMTAFREAADAPSRAGTEDKIAMPAPAQAAAPVVVAAPAVQTVAAEPAPAATVKQYAAHIDYDGLAQRILATDDKDQQKVTMRDVIDQHRLKAEQTQQLSNAITLLKSQRKPSIDPSVFNVLDDE
jgi:hypothetical protein